MDSQIIIDRGVSEERYNYFVSQAHALLHTGNYNNSMQRDRAKEFVKLAEIEASLLVAREKRIR